MVSTDTMLFCLLLAKAQTSDISGHAGLWEAGRRCVSCARRACSRHSRLAPAHSCLVGSGLDCPSTFDKTIREYHMVQEFQIRPDGSYLHEAAQRVALP